MVQRTNATVPGMTQAILVDEWKRKKFFVFCFFYKVGFDAIEILDF